MALSEVREHLRRYGKAEAIIEFDTSSSTVELAAQALGTEPARIAKTLAFLDGEDQDRAILVVAAGDARLHSGSFKRQFGFKARMLPHDLVEPLTGHPVGGVCPFANPPGTRVYLDESLRRFDTVFPAAGSTNSAIRLDLSELEETSGALGWVAVTRLPEETAKAA